MNWKTILLSVVLFDFVVLSGYVVAEVGYIGLLEQQLSTLSGLQVFTDLAIACVLACLWIVADARRRGKNPWPYVTLILFSGSIGILAYLLGREWQSSNAVPNEAQPA